MPLFKLWRVLDHTLNGPERNGMSIRAIGAGEWFPGVRWQRSYYVDEPGRLLSLCAYEGPSMEAVREHSLLCAVPFVEIREVVELPGPGALDDGPDLAGGMLMVQRDFGPNLDLETITQTLREMPSSGDVSWIRSYVDIERGTTHCIVRAAGRDVVRTHAAVNGLPCGDIEVVGENHPAFWVYVYDSLGLPRHWEHTQV